MPPRHDDSDTDEEDVNIDPELRLRTVRTAHSALEESIRTEQRVERRKTRRRRRTFWRKKETQHDQPAPTPASEAKVVKVPGERRNIYVNHSLGPSELDSNGEPIVRFQRNKVRTTSTSAIFLAFSYVSHWLFLRVYCPHFCAQESVRAIQTVCVPPQIMQCSVIDHICAISSVANIFFLTLVILQCQPCLHSSILCFIFIFPLTSSVLCVWF